MKHVLFNCLFLLAVWATPTVSWSQPANDMPCNATPIAVNGQVQNFTTTGATEDPNEGTVNLNRMSPSVWFTFTAPASGSVVVSTCDDSTFDTVLFGFQVGDCADFTSYQQLGVADDECGGGTASQMNLNGLTPGTTYYITVVGFNTSQFGDFTLSITDPNPVVNNDAPGLFNYQAVLRDGAGAISQNQAVAVEFLVLQGSATGTEVYGETHNAMTNEFGLINLSVGGGTTSMGSIGDIDWGAGPYFLEVILDGSSAGVQELVSVPYSQFASKANSADEALTAMSAMTAETADFATSAGTANTATNANFATAAGTANDDLDRNPTNEIQTLSIADRTISLTGGGSVTVPSEIQTLSIADRTISLSDGGSVTVPATPLLWENPNVYAVAPVEDRSVGVGTAFPSGKFEVITQMGTGAETVVAESALTSGQQQQGNPWQSFTPTQSGYITSIRTLLGGGIAVGETGQLNIYQGEGLSSSGATLLHSQLRVPNPQFATDITHQITQPVRVEAGQVYTILMVNTGWEISNANDPYPGGRSGGFADRDFHFAVTVAADVESESAIAVSNGRVGIGTIFPREKLEVVGNICYTGTIGACSDERYKTDFAKLENSLDKVMQLNGLYYNWKREEFPEREFTDQRQIGVIAQEVEALFPEIVLTGEDGYKSVDYGKLTPILLEAIKEQQAIIEAMQAENNQLRTDVMARLDALEGRTAPAATNSQITEK